MEIRRFQPRDAPRVWALDNVPNIGETADPSAPLDLPSPLAPPTRFPFLADVEGSFLDGDGEFLVVEHEGHLVGMGGIRRNTSDEAEVLHIRVHPAMRRKGVGTALLGALESQARALGFARLHLDTATNQPEAVAFYRALGYAEAGTETRPGWSWTLQYFTKDIGGALTCSDLVEAVMRTSDGELCGYVEARDGQWHALTVFGAVLGSHDRRTTATDHVLAEGLSSLAERWTLRHGESGDEEVVCIQEVNDGAVTVARGYYSLPGVPTLTVTMDQIASGEWELFL